LFPAGGRPMTSPSASDASSLFDVRGSWRDGSASSSTSIDEDVASKFADVDTDINTEHGLAGKRLWDTVASVAGVLTVSVNKAWSTNVSMEPGEETPPGQDSRITRALKAYHISKARDPSELPEWLFEPHERMPGRRRHQTMDEAHHTTQDPLPRSRTLRSADAWSNPSDRVPSNKPADDKPTSSTATDRLKALRAKRNAHATSHQQQREEDSAASSFRQHEDDRRHRETFARREPPRSLPSGVRPHR
jgi:hypothetical protein